MPVTLEIRKRVQLSSEPPTPRPRRQPSLILVAGLVGWGVALVLGYGITTGTLPVRDWVEGRSPVRSERPRRVHSPLPPAVIPSVSPTALADNAPAPSSSTPMWTAAGSDPLVVREQTPASSVSTAATTQSPPVMPCEAALKAYRVEHQLETPDAGAEEGGITRDQHASILERGLYFRHCDVPVRVRIDVCAAVHLGSVVGVTVHSEPHDVQLERCIALATYSLLFPHRPTLDVTRVSFR